MPVRSRRPEDNRPLFKAVNEQRLIRPVGGAQEEPETHNRGQEAPTGSQTPPQAEGVGRTEKGPIARALDRAQENNWVYGSMADAARRSGLVDGADRLLSRLTG